MTRLLPLLLLCGCSLVGPWSLDGYRSRLASLAQEIDEAVGEARADTVAACRVITFGYKSCGGPTQFRVYSETHANPARVRRLAEEYTDLERAMVRRHNLGSTCDILTPPPAVLEGGRCVAQER